jgi:hypothetical protein
LNRKLLILDVVLGAGVIYGGLQLHSQWVAAKARQAGMPGAAPKTAPPPGLAPLPQQPAVLPSGYKAIAVNTLFDPSRNPNIPVDPPPPPPPPAVPPPLPAYHGSMDIGDGPVAMMSENGSSAYKKVHPGGVIGPFKLLSFGREEFAVEWEGKVIHKRLDEGGAEKSAAAPQAVEPAFTPGLIPGRAPAETTPPPPQPTMDLGPGTDMTESIKACQPGDSSPPGTVSGGYRKEVNRTPLGSSQCIWRAVGK